MSSSLANAMSISTPENEVQGLINQVADETGIELNYELPGSTHGSVSVAPISAEEEDGLTQRLARLRQSWDIFLLSWICFTSFISLDFNLR